MFRQFQTPINYEKLIEVQATGTSYRLNKNENYKKNKKGHQKVKKITVGRRMTNK